MKKTKKKTGANSVSPYRILTDWFLSETKEDLDIITVKALNPISILSMFGTHGNLTIFLNKYFNNYNLHTLDRMQFFRMLKEMVKEKQIGRYNFSFFRHIKEQKDITKIHKKFPMLKRNEIPKLMELIKDTDDEDGINEILGLTKSRKKKLTKAEKKEIEKPTTKKITKRST